MNATLERISVLLARRGMSRNELARKTGINSHTLQGYWKNDRIPRGDDLVRVAQALDSTAEYLITGIERSGALSSSDPLVNEILKELRGRSRPELLMTLGALRMINLKMETTVE
jgi:transcriptional regulator with XRE-family HTH domain